MVNSMSVSYSSLLERVGHYLFGIRSGFSSDQVRDIQDCMCDGLRRVYSSYDWSFFRPVKEVTTTAPYATGTVAITSGVVTLTGGAFPSWAADGVLVVDGSHYLVASRGSDTQITLNDITVSVSSGMDYQLCRPEITLSSEFASLSPGDTNLVFAHSQDELSPPVVQRHDSLIRKMQQQDPMVDRPIYYALRTESFDPTVGSRKSLVFYPMPDKAYVLLVPMVIRPDMLDEINQYPVGGEQLSQLILEACLASAEHNFEEREHVHEKKFMEMLSFAVQMDQERSSPSSLGRDAPLGMRSSGVFSDDYYLRQQRIGSLYIEGEKQ